MPVTEAARNELFLAIRALLERQPAETLMELLPPVGWGDVATRRDLDLLDSKLTRRIDLLDSKLTGRIDVLATKVDVLEERIVGRLTLRLVAFNLTFAGILVAALAVR